MKRKNSNHRYLEDPERQRRHGALFLTILFCAVLGLGTASLLFLPKQTYSPRENMRFLPFRVSPWTTCSMAVLRRTLR